MDSFNQNKYPENNPFSLKQNNTNYTYTIIKEGFYPPKNIICYTSARSRNKTQFKIPDEYLVQTSWGRGNLRHTVKCEIEYESDGQPVFRIWFEENFQQHVIKSKESPTRAANKYLQVGIFINRLRILFIVYLNREKILIPMLIFLEYMCLVLMLQM